MKKQIAIRLSSNLDAQISAIVADYNADLEVGRVTKTDVLKMLLEKGVQKWTVEKTHRPCPHYKTVETCNVARGGDDAYQTWVICLQCGEVVGGIE